MSCTVTVPELLKSALGLLATLPIWYLLASIGHLIARAFGGRGSHYGARLALFWALVVISPAMLFHGLVLGLAGNSTFVLALGGGIAAGFVLLWVVMLREVER